MGRLIPLLLLLALAACGDSTVSPTPPPAPAPPPVEPPPPPPPANPRVDTPVDVGSLSMGYSFFAASMNTDEQNDAFTRYHLSQGGDVQRVCAEHETWDRHGLRKSDPALSPAQLANVERLLDVTARIAGAKVKLMLVCNMKENGRSIGDMERWTRMVTSMIRENDYQHVWVSVANEPWHPQSSLRDASKVNQLIGAARAELGGGYVITVDDNFGGPRDITYNREYRSDFPEAHPWRVTAPRGGLLESFWSILGLSQDWERLVPTGRDMERIGDRNGRPFVISEPIAWNEEGNEEPCCTQDWDLIVNYKRAVERNGGLFFFHSKIAGLNAFEPHSRLP